MKTKKYRFSFLAVVLLFLLPSVSWSQGLANCKGKYLGNIIAGSVRSDFNTYWNAVTAENGCKWGSIESTRNQMNWTAADRAYNHAKNNGFPFRWHTFAWGSQYPSWITSLSAADFRKELEEYIRLVSERYPNSIDQIDVVNEALRTHAPGTSYFRDALGGTGATGYDWIVWCFQTTRKYFPNAKLVLNDYGLENDQSAIREMLQIVKVLKDRNLIDGFGTQAHEFNINTLSASALKSSLDLMATGGVPIYVTELDISGDDATQRTRYQTLFPVYWEHPNVAGVTLWGYVEGQTWKANTGLLNSNGTERPAMTWLKSYMASRPNVSGCGTTTNTPPTVSITSPSNNAAFTAPASVTISATASDANGTVSNVQFYNGSTLLGSDATSPYSFTWSNVAAGTYTITARATDNAGATTTSSAITVVVNAPTNTPPAVSITAPANNAAYTAPASITISASASDANGTVSNVQFYNGSTLLGSDATSPYSFTWNNVAAGTYTITARATDNAGATTTSLAITVTVTNPVVQSPYGGTVANIPGKIEAERYDLGGQGVSFNDLTTGNSGNAFRADNVDIEATTDVGGGYNVGWVSAGEWLEYAVNVTAAGSYNLEVRVASINSGRTFHVEMDGANISGTIAVPNTGGWQAWQSVTISNINLTAGQKVMRVVMDGADFNLNYITFSAVIANTPPAVSITSPSNNAAFTAPASITINATASDADGTISSVQFYNGTALLGSDASSPYSFTWTNVAAGSYSVTARATDNSGATTTSSAVSIMVNNAPLNQAPAVSISSPSNNATFTAPASITINATASDADGTLSNVQFYNGSTLLGSDATSPYSFTWSNIASGTYSITARATDNSGAVSTSSAITVTVNAVTPGGVTIQAETACSVDGTLNETYNSGYHGTGYSNTTDAIGASITLAVNSQTSQTTSLDIRYAHATSAGRSMSLKVNGVVQVSTIPFPSTGSGTTWVIVNVPITLSSGANTVQLVSLTNEGSPYVDELTFGGSGISVGSCGTPDCNGVIGGTATIDNCGTCVGGNTGKTACVDDPDDTCPTTAIPAASDWTVRNDWADQNNGSGFSNTTDALRFTHRQWGRNFAWLIQSGKKVRVEAGKTYEISFDFRDDASIKVTSLQTGFASGYQWNGPVLTQPVVTMPLGTSSSNYTTKTINITATVSGDFYLVIREEWPGQPSAVVNNFIKNLKVCEAMASNAEILTAEAVIAPNPSTSAFTLTVQEAVQHFTVINGQGQAVLTGGTIEGGTSIVFGQTLTSGYYTLKIQYASGRTETKKIQKVM